MAGFFKLNLIGGKRDFCTMADVQMFEEEGHVSGSESGEEGRDGGRIGTSPIPSVDRASTPVTEPAAPETGAMSIQTVLDRLRGEMTARIAN